MGSRDFKQTDFSGGEISSKLLMRADTEMYQKSLFVMQNFRPTLQGTSERTPGGRFVREITNNDDQTPRIIPLLTSTNNRALVILKEGSIEVLENITENLDSTAVGLQTNRAQAIVPIRRQIVQNFDIVVSEDPWVMQPTEYQSNGDRLGLWWVRIGAIDGVARNKGGVDIDTCTIKQKVTVDYPTAVITTDFRLDYRDNFQGQEAPYRATVQVGTFEDGANIMDVEVTGEPGTVTELLQNWSLPTQTWTGDLYIKVQWVALANSDYEFSTPYFRLDRFALWIDGEVDVPDGTVPEPPPYLAEELLDVHFVQSPYGPPLADPLAPAKPLVLTHPNHRPHWLYFNVDDTDLPLGWRFVPIPFINQPVQWNKQNYPATCGSSNGRLILAGALVANSVAGDPFPNASETVWGTEVGRWDKFSTEEDVDPDDSIEFTTTYRSPIQWVYGQKDLLVGALEMEYVASADSIFSPQDIGVFMQSTHGSTNVQPIAMGEEVFFPAEAGTKVRSMRANQDQSGWISPDMTLLYPDLCRTGIRRMVRMRNPSQQAVILLNSGEMALLNLDTQAGISGWSRVNLGYAVRDIAVVADSEGVDVLYMTTRRYVNGAWRLYLEAIPNWVHNRQWDYVTTSTFRQLAPATNVITDLDHLEGFTVQVVADRAFVGNFPVINGTVTLVDQIGNPINCTYFLCGTVLGCEMVTLPPNGNDPGAPRRFSEVSVRIRGSSRPLINGIRPPDRTPSTLMDQAEDGDLIADHEVADLGSSIYAPITINEPLPKRVEILGIYGKLTENSL